MDAIVCTLFFFISKNNTCGCLFSFRKSLSVVVTKNHEIMGRFLIDDEEQLKDCQTCRCWLQRCTHATSVLIFQTFYWHPRRSSSSTSSFFPSNKRVIWNFFFFLRSLEPARGYPYTTLTMGCSDRHRRNCEVINVAPYVSWPFEAQRQLNIPPALALRCLLFFTCRFVSSNSHNQHLYLPLTSCSSAPHSLTPSASLSARDQVSHP